MTREQLADASDRLRAAAADAGGDLEARLEEQADRVDDLAEREFGPDHGTLARLETKLGNLAEEAPATIAEEIDAALADVRAFRSTVDGV